MKESESVKNTIAERGAAYGDFTLGVSAEAAIMQQLTWLHRENCPGAMKKDYEVLISKIVMKLVRLAVTPDHADSWHDIAGYAILAEKYVTKKGEDNAKSK